MEEGLTQGDVSTASVNETLGNISNDVSLPENTSKERMLPQTTVDKLVAGVKREAYEKGQRDAQDAWVEARKTEPVGEPRQSLGGMPQMTQEQVRQMIAEEAQKKANEDYWLRFANDFVTKLDSGKSKYDPQDFDTTIADLNLSNIPQLVELTGGLDNVADVMYHLGKNPSKFGNLVATAYVNPKMAQRALHDLSHSLKNNDANATSPSIPEPLSQIQASTAGSDSGKTTIRDLRSLKQFRR